MNELIEFLFVFGPGVTFVSIPLVIEKWRELADRKPSRVVSGLRFWAPWITFLGYFGVLFWFFGLIFTGTSNFVFSAGPSYAPFVLAVVIATVAMLLGLAVGYALRFVLRFAF